MTTSPRFSRRQFVTGTFQSAIGGGVLLSLPAITIGRALGADIPVPSNRVRIGIIGLGPQGNGNMGHVLKNVTAVCDVDATRLAAGKARVEAATGGTCAAYADYRKLLDDKTVDAVVVSTPDHWHALISADACAAGKDVYCEKPLTHNVREGRALVDAARRHNRVFQTGSMQRSDPHFRQACELVRSGKLGKIKEVRVGVPGANFRQAAVPDSTPPPELDYQLWLGPAPDRPYNVNRVHYFFRFFWDYAGGQMTNWGAHHLDIVQWALDMDHAGPISAEGTGQYDPQRRFETPQSFDVTYVYPDGTPVRINQKNRDGVTFEGEAGTVWVNRGKIEATPAALLTAALQATGVHLPVSTNHFANWLDSIQSRQPPICDVETGHRSATVCHLGNIAILTGRKIHWDAATEAIANDPEASRRLGRSYRPPWSLPTK